MSEHYKTACLTDHNDGGELIRAYEDLQSDDADLEILFTVDILNGGIDIPGVNMVLFLGPRESSTVFVQQLGRGLRKFANKQHSAHHGTGPPWYAVIFVAVSGRQGSGIGVVEQHAPGCGRLSDIFARFPEHGDIALTKLIHHIQIALVDVHEGNFNLLKLRYRQNIFEQSVGKTEGPCTKKAILNFFMSENFLCDHYTRERFEMHVFFAVHSLRVSFYWFLAPFMKTQKRMLKSAAIM